MRSWLTLTLLISTLCAACDDDDAPPNRCEPPTFELRGMCLCPQGYGVSERGDCVPRDDSGT